MTLRRWLPSILWAGLILVGTSLPSSAVPQQVSTIDKVLHFSIYLLFGVLLSRQLSEASSRWRAALIAAGVTMAFGAVDEWHQQFIPGRSMELADWHADALGGAVGSLIAAFLPRRRDTKPQMTS